MNLSSRLKAALASALLVLSAASLFAQTSQNESVTLQKGFGGIELGMSVDEVKAALVKNPQFGYRGDRDVSLLPGDNRIIIETDTERTNPYSFLTQCYFQFYEEKLYIITINVKTSRMDYYSMFSTLCEKYGNPSSLNPQKAQWTDDEVIMSLEKPLTLKYTDKKVYDSLMNQVEVQNSAEEMSREQFLKGL